MKNVSTNHRRGLRMKRAQVLSLLILFGCHRAGGRSPSPGEPLDIAVGVPICADVTACERACRTGTSGACVEAGRLYEYGHVGPRDPGRAFTFYESSCDLENASGCFNAAILLELGRGVQRNARRAVALYQRVCHMGSRTGCTRAEELSASVRP
jgi:TPR repeat protein